jgi:thiamine pyrophosphate-dependent acetolactate synthase large subunit-like protein
MVSNTRSDYWFSFYANLRYFSDAGITFGMLAHETNGGLIADGYTRATGKMSMVIAKTDQVLQD